MSINNFKSRYLYLIGGMVSLIMVLMAASGTLQQFIPFASVTNEVFFCFLTTALSLVLFTLALNKSSK